MKSLGPILLTASLCLPVVSCRENPQGASTTAPADEEYPSRSQGFAQEFAGSESCTSCHQEIHDLWATSNHAHAQRDMNDELDRSAFTPTRTVTHGSQTSHVGIKDGRHTITTLGPDGEVRDYHPDGALAYFPLRQYLIPFEHGRIQATELAYDPDKDEWFNVYGDEDRLSHEWGHWSQRGMNWNSMCGTCHNTDFEKNYLPDVDGYASTFREMGVGCEQCHGPMKAHVDWRTEYPDAETHPDDPTVEFLDYDQYFSVCGSCHARRSELTEDFAVGDEFLDHYEPVLPDLSDVFYPDGQVREEDFEFVPFLLSYMHGQGVRCINCHESHSGKVRFKGNEMCLQCHSQAVGNKILIDPAAHGHHEAGTPGSNCIDCHMPTTPYMQRHWRHDHGMTIPDPLLTKLHGIPNACTRCHADKSVDWSLEWTQEWYGERMQRRTRDRAMYLAEIKAGDFTHVHELSTLFEAEPNAAWRSVMIRVLMAVINRGPRDLQQDVIDLLTRQIDDPSPLVQAAVIEALEPYAEQFAHLITPKLEHSNRLVRIKAAWAMRPALDPESRAGGDLLARMEVHQDQPLGALQWAHFYAARGQPQRAIPWFEKAIAWDPNSAPFRHDYAVVLAGMNRQDEAIRHLLEAMKVDPESGLYPYDLALIYAEQGHLPQSRDALEAAIAREPGQSRYWYNLALAESQLGNHQAALTAIGKAESLAPHVPDYPYARATMLAQLHEWNLAEEAVRKALNLAPDHAQAQEMLRQLKEMRP